MWNATTRQLIASRKQQHGGFIGLVLIVALLAVVGVAAMQVFPTYLEYIGVVKAVKKASKDGDSVAAIRVSFDKASQIDDITSITGKDLVIEKVGNDWVVKAAWNKEIQMAGPLHLLMKYEASSR
jgi:Domain of unknown function (DUF4845)